MKKIKILGGHTNNTFKLNDNGRNYFLKELKHDTFNHLINYDFLENFDFIPKIIKRDKTQIISEYIESKPLIKNKKNLKSIANIMKTVHNSKIVFPKNNLIARIDKYYKMIHDRRKNINIINDNYELAKTVIKDFDFDSPSHNDP
jgi:thiamine kinase-like enzyme